MSSDSAGSGSAESQWRGLIRLGAAGAGFVLLMIPLQAAVFLLHPPPDTAEGFFAAFQENPLLGLLDLDLLLTLDYLMMIPLYLALYAIVRRMSMAWGLLGLIVGLFSLVLFIVSREATFTMWMLSDQYAAATSETEREALVAVGTGLLALYNGGTFGTSYILGAISTLIFSTVMLRHQIFGRLPGLLGLITGFTMLVPANAGTVGLTIAMLSLLLTAAWLVLLIPHLIRASRSSAPTPAGRTAASTE